MLLMDWCWNHVDCPCCCYDSLLLMIRTLGIHNHWDCCENWFVLEIFTKWVKWWFLFKRCFNSNFIRFWTSFDVRKRLGQIWAWGIQNWGFGMKNEILRQQTVMAREASKLTHHSERRCDREHALLATASRTTRHSEQRGDIEGTLLATAS